MWIFGNIELRIKVPRSADIIAEELSVSYNVSTVFKGFTKLNDKTFS